LKKKAIVLIAAVVLHRTATDISEQLHPRVKINPSIQQQTHANVNKGAPKL
jgi:hypothetical protein